MELIEVKLQSIPKVQCVRFNFAAELAKLAPSRRRFGKPGAAVLIEGKPTATKYIGGVATQSAAGFGATVALTSLAADAGSNHRARFRLNELRGTGQQRAGMSPRPSSPARFSAIALPTGRLRPRHWLPSGLPFGLLFQKTLQGPRSGREWARRACLLRQVALIHHGQYA
jgi:hypothetical protein